MKNDIIFARKINALLFMRVKDECFMAVLPPLHVVRQHFIKHSCGLFLAAKSETGTVSSTVVEDAGRHAVRVPCSPP